MNPPLPLAALVGHLKLEPGWKIAIDPPVEDEGQRHRPWMNHWALVVDVQTINSVGDRKEITVIHGFPVDLPEQAEFTLDDWTSWIFDRILDVHRHEVAEFFTVGSVRPYPPEHGPDGDPYKDPR